MKSVTSTSPARVEHNPETAALIEDRLRLHTTIYATLKQSHLSLPAVKKALTLRQIKSRAACVNIVLIELYESSWDIAVSLGANHQSDVTNPTYASTGQNASTKSTSGETVNVPHLNNSSETFHSLYFDTWGESSRSASLKKDKPDCVVSISVNQIFYPHDEDRVLLPADDAAMLDNATVIVISLVGCPEIELANRKSFWLKQLYRLQPLLDKTSARVPILLLHDNKHLTSSDVSTYLFGLIPFDHIQAVSLCPYDLIDTAIKQGLSMEAAGLVSILNVGSGFQ